MALVLERFTELPIATNANFSDIICAVQGYIDPSNLGTSAQLNLSQIADLIQTSPNISYPGNPNGNVAGVLYQLCWDSINFILYTCVTPGIASVAIWDKSITLTAGSGVTISQSGNNIQISANGTSETTLVVTDASTPMIVNYNYIMNYSGGQGVLILPPSSIPGDEISISGLSSGGWKITLNSSQLINVGSSATTPGSGSVASTNGYDSLTLRCLTPNIQWSVVGGVQSLGLTII